MPLSPTLLDENEEGSSSSGPEKSSSNSSAMSAGSTISTTSSRTCSTSSSSSSSSSSSMASDDETNHFDVKLADNSTKNGGDAAISATGKESDEEPSATIAEADALLPKPSERFGLTKEENIDLPSFSPNSKKEAMHPVRQSIYYNNRDILDLGSNLRAHGGSSGEFAFQYAELPVTNNIQFFLQNRSQYHRLGPNGHVQEFRMATCTCCDFKYPVNTVGANSTAAPLNQTSGMGGNINGAAGAGVVPSSSRFNNGVYGSGAVSGASSPNAQSGGMSAAGSGSNGGFFNNNLMGRDQFNPMASMTMQYNHNSSGAYSKGISQSNGASSQQPSAALRQQQQYEMSQQQKQYVNNYSLGVNTNMVSNVPTGSNWKNSMTNNTMQETATKLFMELNKAQQQQQSPYYVPFL
uniref:Uncharacterized protein n=1 Tax=Anopheles christyi TaxID=43041 RepID=A0A182KGW7_9DIPT